MKEVKQFINGEFVSGSTGHRIENIAPHNGELINFIQEAGPADVDLAVNAARQALTGEWAGISREERVELLYEIAAGIGARSEEFLSAECLDTGKPRGIASHIDIPRGAANFRIFADTIKQISEEAYPMPTPDGTGAINYTVRRPKGVIAVVGPWNFPLLLMTWKVGPALACGNTVIVKPSEETPTTTSLLGEVMNSVGIPPGVFNVVLGRGAVTGQSLISHPEVDALTFTGSTATGQKVMQAAAIGVRDVSLELGGKNPAIVFGDCDIDKAIEGTTRSAFANCGQVCLGTERVYVHRSIFDEFVDRLRANAESLSPGAPDDPTSTLGPLISSTHRDKVLGYYQLAREEGAECVTGGGVPAVVDELKQGFWVEPTIWTGLPESSPVMREEIFGPCCHVTPFDSEEEAIQLANDTPYGLASAIWTESVRRAHRVAPQIHSGICWVNSWFLRDLRTPFGGSKQSGIGREGGHYSLEFYTDLQNVCLKL